ncbi:hypothetical protein B0H99_10856 [Planomicrobium soli]|uniref:Uncharacterized protein n=1 Tax=Planomicrobium soli TaxID=1176648 RepID=A0A2P8GMF9_9BACL|nr:hypothetical protein B0H99_10856 [Planomicrobium soli]
MEVLAAIVILSIIFVGIMTIFPQMTQFNAKTGTKLDTMNLARHEVAEVVAGDKWNSLLVPDYLAITKISQEMTALGYQLKTTNPDFLRFEKQGDYRYETDIYLKCQTDSATLTQCEVTDKIKLYKVHLKVYGGSQLSSETYSYIPYRVESSGE